MLFDAAFIFATFAAIDVFRYALIRPMLPPPAAGLFTLRRFDVIAPCFFCHTMLLILLASAPLIFFRYYAIFSLPIYHAITLGRHVFSLAADAITLRH